MLKWNNWQGYIGGRSVVTFVGSVQETAENGAKCWLAAQKAHPGYYEISASASRKTKTTI
jgi:hypothetical protein